MCGLIAELDSYYFLSTWNQAYYDDMPFGNHERTVVFTRAWQITERFCRRTYQVIAIERFPNIIHVVQYNICRANIQGILEGRKLSLAPPTPAQCIQLK